MTNKKFESFARNIELVSSKLEDGAERVWGWFRDGDQAVTFWRRSKRDAFKFKKIDTYSGDTTLTMKVDQKLEDHGYIEAPRGCPLWRSTVNSIYSVYWRVKHDDAFHHVAATRVARQYYVANEQRG